MNDIFDQVCASVDLEIDSQYIPLPAQRGRHSRPGVRNCTKCLDRKDIKGGTFGRYGTGFVCATCR
jgi:hypothetical protein